MSLPFAIKTEAVSKLYRLGERLDSNRTLRDTIVAAVHRFNPLAGKNGKAESQADLWALDQVSFQIQPGEVVGVIGRNVMRDRILSSVLLPAPLRPMTPTTSPG